MARAPARSGRERCYSWGLLEHVSAVVRSRSDRLGLTGGGGQNDVLRRCAGMHVS